MRFDVSQRPAESGGPAACYGLIRTLPLPILTPFCWPPFSLPDENPRRHVSAHGRAGVLTPPPIPSQYLRCSALFLSKLPVPPYFLLRLYTRSRYCSCSCSLADTRIRTGTGAGTRQGRRPTAYRLFVSPAGPLLWQPEDTLARKAQARAQRQTADCRPQGPGARARALLVSVGLGLEWTWVGLGFGGGPARACLFFLFSSPGPTSRAGRKNVTSL